MSLQPGLAAATAFLERQGAPYEVVEHEPTQSAAADARAAGMPPERVAKTVVLRDEKALRLAVIPASERLDMHKVKDKLGSRGLRILCSGGDHEHAILVDPRDLVQAGGARVADICEG
jgi:Ala-tRNA(Pro) deacylase